MLLYIDGVIITELKDVAPLAIEKLLKGLEDIDGQAEAVAQASYDSWLGEPVFDDDAGDPSSAVDAAEGHAQEVYEQLRQLEQGAINLLAVWLFQFFELHKRDYIGKARLRKEQPADFEKLAHWPRIEGLKAIAETIKHGEDRDGELRKNRPDLFEDPILKKLGVHEARSKPIRMPLAGDGPYLTVSMLHEYVADLVALWEEAKRDHERLNEGSTVAKTAAKPSRGR